MATSTYTLLQRTSLNATASSVTFSNIPQTGYTDLKVVCTSRDSDTSGGVIALSFNGVTTNLSSRGIYGNGSTVTPTASTTAFAVAGRTDSNDRTANTFGSTEFYIANYTSSNYKTVQVDSVEENNASNSFQGFTSGVWASTSAITSITLTPGVSPFVANSTFSLYAISAAGTTPGIPKAIGGDIVVNDGTYWYHAFLSTGVFTPNKTVSADYLVVAGGGGASGWHAGNGGGAGGLRYQTSQSLTAQNYTVIVGAGGAGSPSGGYGNGVSGADSIFNSLTSTGGGGAPGGGASGQNGGSGSGVWPGNARTSSSPVTSPVQGYAGSIGVTNSTTYTNGGGGGGAGGAASDAVAATRAGNGGIGFTSSLTNAMGAATKTGVLSSSNYYFAGGGGGCSQPGGGSAGTGGTGGGGAGGANTAGFPGMPNTGGGGGGSETAVTVPGTNGGSGIVIIRYAI